MSLVQSSNPTHTPARGQHPPQTSRVDRTLLDSLAQDGRVHLPGWENPQLYGPSINGQRAAARLDRGDSVVIESPNVGTIADGAAPQGPYHGHGVQVSSPMELQRLTAIEGWGPNLGVLSSSEAYVAGRLRAFEGQPQAYAEPQDPARPAPGLYAERPGQEPERITVYEALQADRIRIQQEHSAHYVCVPQYLGLVESANP